MADVQVGGNLDFVETAVVIGVDPGSRSTGVCLMRGDGTPRKSWSVKAPAGQVLDRMRFIRGGVARIFDMVEKACEGRRIEVVIEEGVFRARPKVCSMLGEVRGLVMAEAWRRGWSVRKVYPVSWKSGMTKPERAMKKDAQYTAYWSRRLSREFRTPDEVDATLIGIHGARR